MIEEKYKIMSFKIIHTNNTEYLVVVVNNYKIDDYEEDDGDLDEAISLDKTLKK